MKLTNKNINNLNNINLLSDNNKIMIKPTPIRKWVGKEKDEDSSKLSRKRIRYENDNYPKSSKSQSFNKNGIYSSSEISKIIN